MAAKISFPNRACPKCGKPIHVRKASHDCGWKAKATSAKASTNGKKVGRPKGRKMGRPAAAHTAKASEAAITIADIQAVKSLAERLGADKLRQLAEVLA